MKKSMTILAISAALALYGCDTGTTGGPGTTTPESEKPMMGQTDDTFSLDLPMMSASVEQGEQETVSIGINRGTNFAQDVSLKFSNIPPGIHIQPEVPVIARTDEEVELLIHASEEAAVGDFTVQISGHPERGDDATAELSITVSKREMDAAAEVQMDQDRSDRDEEIARMRAELDALQAKYEDLEERASETTDDTREALNEKVADAKVKLEEAEENLEDARDASPDRWAKVKDGFRGAADELKGMFE